MCVFERCIVPPLHPHLIPFHLLAGWLTGLLDPLTELGELLLLPIKIRFLTIIIGIRGWRGAAEQQMMRWMRKLNELNEEKTL